MAASEARPMLWVAAGLVGFFAIFHGHAHGTELPPDESGVLYSIGFVVATGMLHLTGVGIGLIHRWKAGEVTLRLGGAGVAITGLVFLWDALTWRQCGPWYARGRCSPWRWPQRPRAPT